MELLNPPMSKTPQLFSSFSSFTPRLSIKTSNKKPLRRLHIIPSFPLGLPSRGTNVFRVSAHFSRKTSRRNSLRKKLLDHQKVRENPIPLNPSPDFQNPNGGSENFEKFNSGSTKQIEIDNDTLKSKRLGESVLLSKLENWVDQYKKDAEFWGIGSSPVFTVLQDLEGNVKGVIVHEDEILKRLEFEDMEKVNSKVLYARNLAREMERGENVIPRTSSVAKFVVTGEESGFISGIRGVIHRPGFIPKLSSFGTLVLGGLILLWAVKLFALGKKVVEYTELEKEMMRRKIRSRKGKDILEKGSVEVVQAFEEPPSSSFQRPLLDKQELMNNILKAKAAMDKLAFPDSSGSQSSKSEDFEGEIQEIKLMANEARGIEGREQFVVAKDERECQAANKEFSDEMQPTKEGRKDGASFLSNLSTEDDSEQGEVSYKAVEPISSNEPKDDGVKFLNGVASLDSRVRLVTDASSVQLPKDEQSTNEDLKNTGSTLPVLVKGECNQSPVITDNESYSAKSNAFGKKPRVILSVKEAREFLSTKSNKEKLNQEPVEEAVQKSTPDLILLSDKRSGTSTKQIIHAKDKMFPYGMSRGDSEPTASENACQSAIQGDKESMLKKENDDENSDEECREEAHQQPLSSSQESIGMSREQGQSVMRGNWIENNFHEVEPVLKKIGDGFRENYMVAREKVGEQLNVQAEIKQLGSNEDENELEWMKDDRLRDIVFQVRENELAGRDPFYLMDAEEKLAFFQGLEKKVEKENEKLSHLHEWLHSNIENLDYGTDGISLHDPPEKIIPRWKGPPLEKSPEFLSNFQEQRKALFTGKVGMTYPAKRDGQSFLQKPTESPINEDLAISSSESDLTRKVHDTDKKDPKIVIESSDGSVKPGKKSGKEYWQHTKKWSRGFLECYNAETDPEVKSIMKDMGKDLDRWITEKEVQEAADLMKKLPERNKKFMEKKLNKLKREMELFGPQAVVSKYQEYAEEKEEDYLWWLDLPHVLCIELYTFENEGQRIGFYALEMAADLELEPKPHHVIAFEDTGDCKSFCYIMQAHLDMLGNGRAFIVPQPPKYAFREAKANGFGVTVIKKGELQLNVDQTLEEVEEQICEIGSKMYHDKIMRERSVDISSLMKGMLGVGDKPRRRRSKNKLKKPSKN
ncbi:uncharacterized protein LOC105802795 isoform X1 [Gossypium raimondii]|uniref:Embryo defective 1703 n=1 Tax=Gossypium raimondii TaxID=29730 RepID=A0A0D2QQM4_GOSRA|nr:uncharacterized protein LOC105802795 isoform X1 [Gossypium raimondii]KJB41523.1 hypothetical protein B456_007G108400 [Gossypium raimondii]